MPLCADREMSVAAGRSLEALLGYVNDRENERRSDGRSVFAFDFRLTALDRDASERVETCVVGRDISARGVGFEHEVPLPFRRVRLQADDPRLEELGLADLSIDVVLRWCRFLGEGRYESGGRIARSRAL